MWTTTQASKQSCSCYGCHSCQVRAAPRCSQKLPATTPTPQLSKVVWRHASSFVLLVAAVRRLAGGGGASILCARLLGGEKQPLPLTRADCQARSYDPTKRRPRGDGIAAPAGDLGGACSELWGWPPVSPRGGHLMIDGSWLRRPGVQTPAGEVGPLPGRGCGAGGG